MQAAVGDRFHVRSNIVGQPERTGEIIEVTMVPDAATVVRLGHTTFYQRAQRRLRLTGSVEAD